MIDLAGKSAVVTGGANGIGLATARLFAALGARVFVFDTDATQREMVDGEPSERLVFVEANTANEDSVASAMRRVNAEGGLDILVNGAARFVMRGLEASVSEWQEVINTNIIGYTLVSREAVPLMERRGHGAIVNVASISATIAQNEHLTYSTTKAAVLGLTNCMAKELAPKNIRVNAVSPGTVWTERTERYIGESFGLNREQADRHPEIGGPHMLHRTADTVEVARTIAFLASDAASFVTSANLVVDGGCIAQ